MSLNRVSSLGEFEFVPGDPVTRSRRGSDASVLSARAQKLTFNPLVVPDNNGNVVHPVAPADAIGAFEVPRWKRILQIASAVFYCVFASGIVFGYAAIKPVLKGEGVYREICSRKSVEGLDEDTCVEIRMNLMFTVAAVSTNVAALPIGAILDHAGPRVCGLLGSFFLAGGAAILAHAEQLPFDGYLAGYLGLALGGPFIYMGSFHLSNALPRSGLILALLTGAFDSSSAVFLIYRIVYQATEAGFGLRSFFLAYLVVPAAIILLQLTLLPKNSYKTVGEMIEGIKEPDGLEGTCDQIDEHTALLQEEARQQREEQVGELLGTTRMDTQVNREVRQNIKSGVWGIMHNSTIKQQLLSPWFILIMLFTVIQMTRINYFVATVRPQYEALLGSHNRAVEVNNFFDLALPLGGIVSIPFIGMILDNTRTVTVLITLVAVATAIGVLGVIPYAWAAYSNICLFVLYRPFYYTAVSDFSAKVFGFRTFGVVYGTIICLSGLFNLSQPGLDYLFHQTFQGDPVPVNLMLASAGLAVGISLVVYVGTKSRRISRNLLEQEAESAFADREAC
ncbi:hypothetical protein RB597_004632 [Gaeumannomyces tritici]